MKRIILIFVVLLAMIGQVAYAQKTCVIASAEDHVPIREALIHTNNNHWARTDYRGYWTMRYQFDSATVSKPGYMKATIRYKELPDTVFLLPEAKQLGEVTVWGKNQENVGKVKSQACQEAVEAGRNAALGHTRLVGFDLGNMMDSQGRRDQKHLKEAKKVFSKMENKDPLINAYEKATGKKYELNNPINLMTEFTFHYVSIKSRIATPYHFSSLFSVFLSTYHHTMLNHMYTSPAFFILRINTRLSMSL